jgi:hypothetical protein
VIEIRSYRAVFDLERRIYRVDRLRLNPGGIPVRGVVYFLAILLATLISGGLPLVGDAVGVLPWYLRDLALPVASATVLSVIRIEGRPFHQAAYALARYRVGPRRLAGARPCRTPAAPGECWHPREILLLPDGSDARLRRLRYTGPGAVLITAAHERIEQGAGPLRLLGRGRSLILRELPGRRAPGSGQVIALAPGGRVDVHAAAAVRESEAGDARAPAIVRRGRWRR